MLILAGIVLLGTGVGTAQATKPEPNHKVTLCHRTGSAEGGNTHIGYSIITVDIASVANSKDVRGHDSHDQIGNGPGGDIIPSYTYKEFTYPGKNLVGSGAAFLANGCKQPYVPPTVTATTIAPVTVGGVGAGAPPAAKPPTAANPPVTVKGVGAVAPTEATANPLPMGASAGAADTGGQLVAGGFAAFAGFLMLVAGFVLRRRHGEV